MTRINEMIGDCFVILTFHVRIPRNDSPLFMFAWFRPTKLNLFFFGHLETIEAFVFAGDIDTVHADYRAGGNHALGLVI